MPVSPIQPLIDRLLLRSELSDEEQTALRDLPADLVELPGARDLVALGEQTEFSFLVTEGVVGRFSQIRNGVRQIVALHIAGDMADLCSVALPKTSWAFHALVPTSALRIAHVDLNRVADRYPRIAKAFWRDCVADMAVMSEWIVSLARRPSDAKLAHLLCELHCRYKQAGLLQADGSYAFTATQAQVAEILGITSVHVNRMIRSLRERGLATIGRGGVQIHDWPQMARLAEFDVAYLHLNERDSTRDSVAAGG